MSYKSGTFLIGLANIGIGQVAIVVARRRDLGAGDVAGNNLRLLVGGQVAVGLDGLEAGLLLKGGHGCFAGVLKDERRVPSQGGQPRSLYVLLRASEWLPNERALLDGQVARSGLARAQFPMGRLDGTSEKRVHGCAWPVNKTAQTASERGGRGG
jgi:hypothetical protein